ncbi:DNA repair protein RecO [Candidatus Dojkabacteria bacterium]|nr:DNA repair protein RecO [Candidatus Dojkabacteria bacterium]
MLRKDSVYILKCRRIKENTLLVTVFSRIYGRYSFITQKGKDLSTSEAIQPFNLCMLQLYQARGLPILKELSVEEEFSPKSNLTNQLAALYIISVLAQITPEDLPLPESFDAVTKIIKKLESISLKKTDIQTVKDFFLKVLLNELGVEGDRDLHEKAEAYFQKQLWKLNMENLE